MAEINNLGELDSPLDSGQISGKILFLLPGLSLETAEPE